MDTAPDGAVAQKMIEKSDYDLAVIDLNLPDIGGLEILSRIKAKSPNTECIILTGDERVETVVTAVKLGAYDYLVKPVETGRFLLSIGRALEVKRLKREVKLEADTSLKLQNPRAFSEVITVNPEMIRILKKAEMYGGTDNPVLISGESGTGKELLARAIHRVSPNKDGPFVAVNIASVSPTLFESEFFGYKKGAFTGAFAEKKGYFEEAQGGTIFLDEVGELQNELQAKLLRVLQEKEIYKIGSSRATYVNVRIVAATNHDLYLQMKQGKFRKDLYYRLNVCRLCLPPLRDRRDDIPVLAETFLKRAADKFGKRIKGITPEALKLLCSYDYPGNVRELQSLIISAVLNETGSRLTPESLPDEIKKGGRKSPKGVPAFEDGSKIPTLAELERDHIIKVYYLTGKNKSRTARILNISLRNLHRKLKNFGL